MATRPTDRSVISLSQLMLDDMAMRAMGSRTQHDYVRHVRAFAAFLRRSPDTATAKDVRRFQLDQREHNVGQSAINATVSALRFLFGVTLERPDLSRRLVLARRPSKLPEMLSVEEGAKLLEAPPGIKYRAARRVAYAMGCACRRSLTSRSCGTCLRSAKTTGSFTQNRRSSAPKRSSPVCRATPTKSRSRTVA